MLFPILGNGIRGAAGPELVAYEYPIGQAERTID